MIEVMTKNGYRRLISCNAIQTVGEIHGEGASKTVITLSNGEVIFTVNTYDEIKSAYYSEGVNV